MNIRQQLVLTRPPPHALICRTAYSAARTVQSNRTSAQSGQCRVTKRTTRWLSHYTLLSYTLTRPEQPYLPNCSQIRAHNVHKTQGCTHRTHIPDHDHTYRAHFDFAHSDVGRVSSVFLLEGACVQTWTRLMYS